ncbi:MAG: hypothetical protein ACMXYB_03170 [Candidatus Woesearchaeota archaeon]
MSREELYLKKIENDVNEKLYDLLLIHLQNVHTILPRTHNNKEHIKTLFQLLHKALDDLKYTNKFNYLQYYRYSLYLINTMLSYKPHKNHLKYTKLAILNKFTQNETYTIKDPIPLRSQMTELRITYDSSYLIYLLKEVFLPQKLLDKALYVLIAIELVEPDHPQIQELKEQILQQLEKHSNIRCQEPTQPPKNYIILLDTNIVLSKVLYDVDNYKISHPNLEEYTKKMELWGNTNTFIISKSAEEEVRTQLEFTISTIKEFCSKNKQFNQEHIISTLQKRFDTILSKYTSKDEQTYEYELKELEEFYSNYMYELYTITLQKIEHKKLSQKLKKLAHREGLLPERGDLQLLFDAIQLKKTHKNVAILSNDKDLYEFNTQLQKTFNINIYK